MGGAGGTPMGGQGGSAGQSLAYPAACTYGAICYADGDPRTYIKTLVGPKLQGDLIECRDGNDPSRVNCGPSYGQQPPAETVKAGTPAFCNAREYAKDGVHKVMQSPLEPDSRKDAAKGTTMTASAVSPAANIFLEGSKIYQPPGYDAAEDGKVAILFGMDAFRSLGDGTFKVEATLDYLIGRKEIPYTLYVGVPIGNNGGASMWFKDNLDKVITELKKKWPKISSDPAYRATIGQSTTGASAFENAWLFTDKISKGIGGSPSFACFMCLGGLGRADADKDMKLNDVYEDWIRACPVKPIRWTATVGSCDIFPTRDERKAAGCGEGSGAGEVDASDCRGHWLNNNRAVVSELNKKGSHAQLFEVQGGGHTPTVWGGVALADQLRFIFKDVICF